MPRQDTETRLDYVIRARDAEFARVSKRVIDRLDRLERQGMRTTRSISGLSGAFAAAKGPLLGILGAGGLGIGIRNLGDFVRGVTQSISAVDSLAKRARALDVGVVQLQAWTQAAIEGGVEATTFERALQRLQRRIGEVTTGVSTEAGSAFEALGVRLRTARGELRSTEQVFRDVLDALDQLSATERAGIGGQLFGRQANRLINITGGRGSQALADREAQYTRFGITEELAAYAERTQNALDVATQQLERASERLGVETDALFNFTTRLTEFREVRRDFYTSLSDIFAEGRENLARFNAGTLFQPPNLAESISEAEGQFGTGRGTTASRAGAGRRPQFLAGPQLAAGARTFAAAAEAEAAAAEAAQRAQEARDRVVASLEGFRLAPSRAELQAASAGRTQRIANPYEGVGGALIGPGRAEYQARVNRGTIESTAREREERELRAAEELSSRLAADTANNFVSAATLMVRGLETAGGALRSFVDQLLLDIAQRAVFDPLGQAIGSAIFGSLGIPGLARGGPVQAGHPYIVGERGPELFVPGQSGAIQPTVPPTAGPTTLNVNLNYSISSTDGPGVRAALAEATPQIRADAVAAVTRAVQRPGSVFARSVRAAG